MVEGFVGNPIARTWVSPSNPTDFRMFEYKLIKHLKIYL
jgi:hypothetical protein